ncbi:MAG TPA: hypothetical protein VFZ83_15550 [Acidimicrobiia bacterium]|nr:hypothetical protein [Acidimicrobiia bacterium]
MNHTNEPVRPGTAIVACIEPHAGHERAFNAWYERDHFYDAMMAGPGACAAARYVATRECKQLRTGVGHLADRTRGSYLTLAWLLPGLADEWNAWVGRRMATLRDQPDRLFAARDHVFTAMYRFAWDARADGGPAPIVALDRDFPGVIAVVCPGDLDAARSWAQALAAPEMPLLVGLAPERTIMAEVTPDDHVVVIGFCTEDPRVVWERRVAPALDPAASGGGPFLRTVPGTDRYVDEL